MLREVIGVNDLYKNHWVIKMDNCWADYYLWVGWEMIQRAGRLLSMETDHNLLVMMMVYIRKRNNSILIIHVTFARLQLTNFIEEALPMSSSISWRMIPRRSKWVFDCLSIHCCCCTGLQCHKVLNSVHSNYSSLLGVPMDQWNSTRFLRILVHSHRRSSHCSSCQRQIHLGIVLCWSWVIVIVKVVVGIVLNVSTWDGIVTPWGIIPWFPNWVD